MLDVSNLNAWYGESHILQGIGIKVPSNGRVAVLGRNGAGKSSLFKSIMNAGPRTEGLVQWEGQDLRTMPSHTRARLGLAMVPEDRRIFPHLTVMENIRIGRGATDGARPPLDPEQLMQTFPMLEPLRRRYGNQLSGGQQQMLAVARGLSARPRMLLLDEPTEGLAPVIVQQLARAVVAACQADGTALLLSEQNLWFARQCTDYLYILDSGRVVFEGNWSELDANPTVKTRYLAL
ncbi:MAG: ABC transporter ATP-binding protein [Burkholderiaceae bacterium]|nr:ABC transporter ATP-binding protein [Burkholderiaceae bacterium]